VAVYGLLGAPPEDLLRLARALGGVGENAWRPVAVLWLGSAAFAGGGVALGAGSLGWPGAPMRARIVCLAAALSMVLSVAVGLRSGLPAYARARYDVELPEGATAEPKWWRSRSGRSDGSVWIMAAVPEGGTWRPVSDVSTTGVPLTAASLDRVRRHLSARGFSTGLAGPGMTALYDEACREMDIARRLQVAREATRRVGEPAFVRLLTEDLWSTGATKAGRDALQTLADGASIAYPTDDSHLLAGDICARSGEVASAKRWYGMAGLPAGRADERASRLFAFTAGTIRGRLTGVPQGWRAKVGIMPARSPLRGLALSQGSEGISPVALRDIVASAAVAHDGQFRIEDVGAGDYVPVVWLRTDLTPARLDLRVRAEPGLTDVVRLRGDTPEVDLGTWRLEPALGAGP
jgi:hypothetical protein